MTDHTTEQKSDLAGKTVGLSFGPYLETIRIEKGIRLEDVARQTRINIDILRYIEAEDLEKLPQEVFVLGFIRAYAKAIGADGDMAVQLYRNKVLARQETVKTTMDLNRMGSRFWLHLVVIVLGLAVIIAAALMAENYWQTKPSGSLSPEGAQTAAGSAADAASKAAVQKEPAQNRNDGKKHLSISTLKNTWIEVVIDAQSTREYNLVPGEKVELEAQNEFQINIGNAGGVDLFLNGEPVKIAGQAGQPVTLKIP